MFTEDDQGYNVVAFEKRHDDDDGTHVKNGKSEIDGEVIQMYLIRETMQKEERFAIQKVREGGGRTASSLKSRRSMSGLGSGANRPGGALKSRWSMSSRAIDGGSGTADC
jgi:hypothetical protein